MVISGRDERGRGQQVGPRPRLPERRLGRGDALLLGQPGLALGLPPPLLRGVALGLGDAGLARTT